MPLAAAVKVADVLTATALLTGLSVTTGVVLLVPIVSIAGDVNTEPAAFVYITRYIYPDIDAVVVTLYGFVVAPVMLV